VTGVPCAMGQSEPPPPWIMEQAANRVLLVRSSGGERKPQGNSW
jgi:hypothetical protein